MTVLFFAAILNATIVTTANESLSLESTNTSLTEEPSIVTTKVEDEEILTRTEKQAQGLSSFCFYLSYYFALVLLAKYLSSYFIRVEMREH